MKKLILLLLLVGCVTTPQIVKISKIKFKSNIVIHRPIDTNWIQYRPTNTLYFQYPSNYGFVTQWNIQRTLDFIHWETIMTNVTEYPIWFETNKNAFYRVVGI